MGEERPKFEYKRPEFPKRAVVTSGMPYGDKELHFGHIGGLWVHADTFARFLRDRIGKDNVIFVSGTDCYGSPIVEKYRKLSERGLVTGSIEDFVRKNHEHQKETFRLYEIQPNLFAASALEPAKEIHQQTSKWIIERLHEVGALSQMSTLQFYDPKFKTLLNGRQVIGKCPIEGCPSEKAYADECDLGHQYMPAELLNPISTLSGEKPELTKITNWYFNLQDNIDILNEWTKSIEKEKYTRPYVIKEIREFFKKPEIYIKKDQLDKFEEVRYLLPTFTEKEDNNKTSITIVFDKLQDREIACEMLTNAGVRYRTGKTLVPFRLTGNLEWGVPAPVIEGLKGQTFWVWPESLWAPISFTKTYLKSIGKDDEEWKKYWCSKDAGVYQFLGEDNMYFYGPAEVAMWLNTQGKNPTITPKDGQLQLPHLVVNKHILFLNKKASSSGSVKPPMARELLNYYTPEQLRMHFLGMGLGNNNVSFMPKIYNPEAKPEEVDPVLKEGNLLTNVFNRVLRTVFYTTQNHYQGIVPYGQVSEDVIKDAKKAILDYEKFMYENKFHQVMNVLDVYIRNINKYWVKHFKEDDETLKQLIVDTLYMIRVAAVLLHPVAPVGSELVASYLQVDQSKFFDWRYIFDDFYAFVEDKEHHQLKTLYEKEDFFKKHPSQFE